MASFENILSPIKIGTHTWKNRVVKGPSATLFAGPDQFVNDTLIGPYRAMAKGGAAAVILGAGISDDPRMLIAEETGDVYPRGYRGYPFIGLYDDKFIPGLKKLTDATHEYGCEAIIQIFQNGPALDTIGGAWCASTFTEEELPSPVPYCYPTRGLTVDEIHAFEQRYIDAAERAKKGGFDGVEVHMANGYLILTFASRIWNHRTDEYGCQSIENRTRLAREIIKGIRERCGADFIIGIRINGQEFGHPDAITMEESVQIAQAVEEAGVDYISVTGYGYGPVPFQYAIDYWQTPEPDEYMKPFVGRLADGLMIEPAARIKQSVSVPVFGVGSLTVEKADRYIGEGRIDLGLFSRGLWADPEIANKLAEGRPEDIRRCNHCGTCDEEGPYDNGKKRCRVNPAFGREDEFEPQPTQTPKRVLVVGGGPAGLEAGRVLAQRGHQVTLCEQSANLAMTLNVATMVKGTHTEDVPALIDWLTREARKEPNLTIRMKTEVTPNFVKEMNPDAIVVAVGGEYGVPDIPGIESKIVQTVPQLEKLAEKPLKLFGADALSRLSKIALPGIGKRCVIIGGQIEGIQGAVFLAQRGKEVTVLEETDAIAQRLPSRYKDRDLHWLAENGVRIIAGVTYRSIDKKGISYLEGGTEKRIDCDTIMVFKSPNANHRLYEELKGLAPEVYAIGACNGESESLMVDALSEGRAVGCRI